MQESFLRAGLFLNFFGENHKVTLCLGFHSLWRSSECLISGCNLQINRKQPDWIHKETKEALWMESATTPPWARRRLAALTQVQASPAETKTLDDDEVSSTDHDFQELATIKSM